MVDWHSVYNDKGLPEEFDLICDMMGFDIGVLYQNLESNPKCGLLLLMASCSKGKLGALNSESYAEHVNSIGKQILTNGNTPLSDEEIEMMVILRMNESFMEHMCQHYRSMVKEVFGCTIVTTAVMTPRRHQTSAYIWYIFMIVNSSYLI